MKRTKILAHTFVEFIPDQLEEGKIYISIPFATAAHKCCCGCGTEVVTPLSPTDWQLTFDGESVSLYPSIGNWSFPCKSHYWIRHNRVKWAARWSQERIETGRAQDRRRKRHQFNEALADSSDTDTLPSADDPQRSMWWRLRDWFSPR